MDQGTPAGKTSLPTMLAPAASLILRAEDAQLHHLGSGGEGVIVGFSVSEDQARAVLESAGEYYAPLAKVLSLLPLLAAKLYSLDVVANPRLAYLTKLALASPAFRACECGVLAGSAQSCSPASPAVVFVLMPASR